jgi:chromosome segregation ATPase
MSNRTNFVEDGMERVQAAYQSVESEIQKIQKQIDEQRQDLTKRTEKELKRIGKELRGSSYVKPYVKRAQSLRNDVTKQLQSRNKAFEKRVETGVSTLLGSLNLASRSEVEKLEKKLNRMNKKLNALDKSIAETPVSA